MIREEDILLQKYTLLYQKHIWKKLRDDKQLAFFNRGIILIHHLKRIYPANIAEVGKTINDSTIAELIWLLETGANGRQGS